MVNFFIPGLIIFGFVALVTVVYLICAAVQEHYRNIKDEALDRLERRMKYLEDTGPEKWKMKEDISALTLKVNKVYNWRQQTLKGYCYKVIEFEKEKGRMHFLVVCRASLLDNTTKETLHIEWEKIEERSPQDCVKDHAVEITLEQATDYLEQGFVWVPAYEKQENWPVINELMK